MPTTSTELRLGWRFRGPPGMANGGFACGGIAALVGGAAEVTLRRPLPLERPLAVRRDQGAGVLLVEDGDALLAQARPPAAEVELAVPAAVSLGEAAAVAGHARYYQDPVFPDCFVCGPARSPGDGLRIFPGPVAGRQLWAAPWTPDPSVADADGRRPLPGAGLAGGTGRAQAGRRLGPARPRRAGARRRQGRLGHRAASPVGTGRGSGAVTARRGVALTPMETRRDVIVRTARLADELGYETVALPEGWGLDSTRSWPRSPWAPGGSGSSPGSCRCGDAPRRRWP
jgi:hypothetical protein